MLSDRFSARAMIYASAWGLALLVTLGGALLGAVEGVGAPKGMWLVFNTVTTTGFGTGPLTTTGQFLVMGLFVLAGCFWFTFILIAIELGYRRFQKFALIAEALRPVTARPRDRLFHDN